MGLLVKGLHTLGPQGLKCKVYSTLFYYETVCFVVFLTTQGMHNWQAWMLAMTTVPSKLMLYCVSAKRLAGNGHWLLGLMSPTQRTRRQEMFCTGSSLFSSRDKPNHSLCLRFSTTNTTTSNSYMSHITGGNNFKHTKIQLDVTHQLIKTGNESYLILRRTNIAFWIWRIQKLLWNNQLVSVGGFWS